MAMTLSELDKLLADWQSKAATIAQNLYDIEGLPTYQRIMGVSGMPRATFTGISQPKVDRAITDFTQLYELFALLKETIDRATSLRSQVPKRGGEPLIQDIQNLLTTQSIALPIQIIPIQSRDILGSSSIGYQISLEDIINQMAPLFVSAKTIILEIDTVWTYLEQRLIELQTRSQPILQQLTQLIQTTPALVPIALQQTVTEFQTQFLTLQNAIDQDPLSANESLITQLEPSLQILQTHLTELQTQKQTLQRDLDEGLRSLHHLRTLHQTAFPKLTEWQSKILDPTLQINLPRPEVITELTQWHDRLTQTFKTGNVLAVQVGLSRWQTQFNLAQTQTQTVIEILNQSLQSRIELRGRLTALKAKASALGRAEDPTLSNLETQAKQQLYSRPTNMPIAQQIVTEYERSVNWRN